MARLIVFNSVSLDGYFVDERGDMSWAHNAAPDEEWQAFIEANASGDSVLLFGRITYELMAGYWPTQTAREHYPVVAERMNSAAKVVFSKTLTDASWNNTRLVAEGMVAEVRALKDGSGPGMTILGSGTIVSQLTRERLIDEYQVAVVPVVIGAGRTMFDGAGKLGMRLTGTRSFANGNVLLRYEPAA